MNDNDIIKALGYCFAVGDCEHCVYADKPCQELMADALSLINRQKAEIERLRAENAEQDQAIINALHHMKVVRVEAIKEFVEELKPRLRRNTHVSPFACNLNDVIIDNLVKEMTEEQK